MREKVRESSSLGRESKGERGGIGDQLREAAEFRALVGPYTALVFTKIRWESLGNAEQHGLSGSR